MWLTMIILMTFENAVAAAIAAPMIMISVVSKVQKNCQLEVNAPSAEKTKSFSKKKKATFVLAMLSYNHLHL